LLPSPCQHQQGMGLCLRLLKMRSVSLFFGMASFSQAVRPFLR
jgi:hypothetical protein